MNHLDTAFRKLSIKSKPLKWITPYLSNRKQTVCIDGILSKPVLMKFSVPQRSMLCPNYYTMYTKPVGGSICKNHGFKLLSLYLNATQFVENVSVTVGESKIKASSCVKKLWRFP